MLQAKILRTLRKSQVLLASPFVDTLFGVQLLKNFHPAEILKLKMMRINDRRKTKTKMAKIASEKKVISDTLQLLQYLVCKKIKLQ